MKERFILVESNTSGTGRHFAAAARRRGLEPLLLAEDPARYPYAQEDGLDVARQVCTDVDELAARLDALAGGARIAGIYSSSEYFIETAAELARRRGLPGPDPQAVRDCRDKWAQRRILREAGVGVPEFVLARTPDEAMQALDVVPLPVVVKPTQGTGSSGVRLCSTRAELASHAEALLAIKANERGLPIPQQILIEEYVRTPEFSAEFFGLTLLGLTRKHVSQEPYFVETGHDFPAPFEPEVTERLAAELRRGLQAVGACWGPTHTEFRYGNGRCAVMEINPRLAGGFIPELVRLATGVDPVASTIALAAGDEPDLRAREHAHTSIRFIIPRGEGRIVAFEGLERAAAIEGVLDVRMYRRPGDRFAVHNDFRDRVGHVLARAAEPRLAEDAARAAHSAIEVRLE